MTVDPETWTELRDARAAAEAARDDWHRAQLKAWRAPPGKRRAWQAELTARTTEAIRADLEVERLARLTGGRA